MRSKHFHFECKAPCPIHFTFFVKWVGDHEINLTEIVKML